VKELGAKNLVLSTDLGQSGNMNHPDGLEMMAAAVLKEGVTQEELDWMTKKNPARCSGSSLSAAPLPADVPLGKHKAL
jgi:hypothetical protein